MESAPVPDAIEPVVGWRTWRVRDTGSEFRLTSVNNATLWEPGEPLRAACTVHNPHDPPHID